MTPGEASCPSASVFEDVRGRLTLLEFDWLPFTPTRSYVLSEIPGGAKRGGHASRTQHRALLMISGRPTVTVDDGHQSRRLELAAGHWLLVSPGTWLEIEAHSENVCILVLADGRYDPADYVSDRSKLPLAADSSLRASQTAAS